MALREDPRLGPRFLRPGTGGRLGHGSSNPPRRKHLRQSFFGSDQPRIGRASPALGHRPRSALPTGRQHYSPRSAPPCSKRRSAPNRGARHQRRDRQQDVSTLATTKSAAGQPQASCPEPPGRYGAVKAPRAALPTRPCARHRCRDGDDEGRSVPAQRQKPPKTLSPRMGHKILWGTKVLCRGENGTFQPEFCRISRPAVVAAGTILIMAGVTGRGAYPAVP
jgi:hypothetical protein